MHSPVNEDGSSDLKIQSEPFFQILCVCNEKPDISEFQKDPTRDEESQPADNLEVLPC